MPNTDVQSLVDSSKPPSATNDAEGGENVTDAIQEENKEEQSND